MKKVKTVNFIIIGMGIVILLALAWSLLNISGLIPTAISPIAYEHVNYSNLKSLSEIVILAAEENTEIKWDRDVFSKYSNSVSQLMSELPDKQQYAIYMNPVTELNIIISGHKKDDLGMIWAVTDKGRIIKIPAFAIKHVN